MSALDALYAQVPDAGCKGLCVDACGPIPMAVEEARVLNRAGHPIPHDDLATAQLVETGAYTCPALVDGRCSAYEVRPLICRLYGAVELLRCEHGCVPTGGFLPVGDAARIQAEVLRVGGGMR